MSTPFNAMKKAQKADYPAESMLEDQRDEEDLKAESNTGNIDWMLQRDTHKDKDNSVPFNKQLEEARAGSRNTVTEGSLNEAPKVYNLKRTDKTWRGNVAPLHLLSEAYDQKKQRAYQAAEKAQANKEKHVADQQVGKQMEDKKTKVVGKQPDSQLAYEPDRFKGVDKSMPIKEKYPENAKTLSKKEKFNELVTASLKDADAMMFHVYASAAYDKRDLTDREKKIIADINEAKSRIMTSAAKVAQFDDYGDYDEGVDAMDWGQDDFNVWEENQVFKDEALEREEAMLADSGGIGLTIQPSDSGEGFDIVDEDGDYVGHYPSAQAAKEDYPEADVEEPVAAFAGQEPPEMPHW